MKNFLLLLLFLITSAMDIQAQRVPSSCEAIDGLDTLYDEDAHRLALKKIYRQDLPEKEEIIIPGSHVDTILRALWAVYNASDLAARDTVVSLYGVIHTAPREFLNYMVVNGDPNEDWAQKLKDGIVPTDNIYIDSFMETYNWVVADYQGYTSYMNLIFFRSPEYYNIEAFDSLLGNVSGLREFGPYGLVGDGADITDSIYSDHVELTYSIGWGDCPAGCIHRRYWTFKVYDDCSVEFAGSYGDALPSTTIEEVALPSLRSYPNPFVDYLWIEGFHSGFDYNIADLSGRVLLGGSTTGNRIGDVSHLPEGMYILNAVSGQKKETFKIVKCK